MSEQTETVINTRYAVSNPPNPTPEIPARIAPDGDGFFFALREGYGLERIHGRQQHRRQHSFGDVQSFAEWLNRHAKDRERTEILVSDTVISAALDPASPTGDVVVCELAYDPRYLAWLKAFGARDGLTQKQFHLLVRAQIGDLEQQVSAMMLAAIRDLTVTSGEQRQIQLDPSGFVRYAGMNQNRQVSGAIPTEFAVTVPVFEGVKVWPLNATGFIVSKATGAIVESLGKLEPGGLTELTPDQAVVTQHPWEPALYPIQVVLSMDQDERTKELRFTLEAPTLAAILRQARRDAAAYLRELLEDGFLVGLGKLNLVAGAAFDTNADDLPPEGVLPLRAIPREHDQPPCGGAGASDATPREAV